MRTLAVAPHHRLGAVQQQAAIGTDATIRYLTVQGAFGPTRIAHTVQRPQRWNGKTIVANHGISRSLRFFNPHVDHWLRGGAQVVRIDVNNAGETLKANPSKFCGLADDARTVNDVIESLDIRDGIYFVGHSRGAAVAFRAALELERHGLGVNGVVASNSFVSDLAEHYLGSYGAPKLGVSAKDFDMQLAARQILRKRPASEAVPGLSFDVEADGVAHTLASMRGDSILGYANKVRAPVTIIASNNEFEPAPLMQRLRDGLRNPAARQFLYEGTEHCFPTANPQKFLSIVDGVLATK